MKARTIPILLLMAAASFGQVFTYPPIGVAASGEPNVGNSLLSAGTTLDITHGFSSTVASKAVIACYSPTHTLLTGWTKSSPDATTIRVTFGSSQPIGTYCNVNATGTGAVGPSGPAGTPAYVYVGYATDSSGTGCCDYAANKNYIAIKTTSSQIATPQASDFTGLWKLVKGADGSAGASAYVYVAYADDANGTGFTTTFNAAKDYIAVKSTNTVIASPAASDFTGLWKNYKGTGASTFAELSGNPTDNSNLATALSGKQNTIGAQADLTFGSETLTPSTDRQTSTRRAYSNTQTNYIDEIQDASNGFLFGNHPSGYHDWKEITTPGTNPASGRVRVYGKAGKVCVKSSGGTETCTGEGGTGTATVLPSATLAAGTTTATITHNGSLANPHAVMVFCVEKTGASTGNVFFPATLTSVGANSLTLTLSQPYGNEVDCVATGQAVGSSAAGGGAVSSVDGRTGTIVLSDLYAPIAHASDTANPHSVTKTQVGLGNVDNTADSAKNVATAVALAAGADRTKLDGIAAGAEVNVNADWNAGAGDAQILNKPTLGDAAAKNTGTSAGTVAAGDHNHSGVYEPADSDLTALAGNSTSGLWARTGAGTGAARSITGTTNKITVTNGNGASGNPTITAGSDLVDKTASTTYTAGAKQTFVASATTAGFELACSALPSSPANGQMACDSGDSNKVKAYSNGAWITIATGGTGIVSMTTGAGDPSGACTAPSSSNFVMYTQTTTQDVWACVATNTWKKVLSTSNAGTWVATGTAGTAPSRPSAGSVTCYYDSTANTQVCLDSGTGTFISVKTAAARTANQFVTHIPTTGIPATAAIAVADLPAAARVRPCEVRYYGSGASSVLQDTDDEAAACMNDTGAALTITAVYCMAAGGTPTVRPIITGGAATSILSADLTCGNGTWSSAGTLNGTPSQASGSSIDANVVSAGGAATKIVFRIVRTL